jgi:hypothetical protein
MKQLLIKWLDKLIYGWMDTMPATREDDPEGWDNMQKELKELKQLRKWASKLSTTRKYSEDA